ncbi:MAG: hypothetical protein ACRDKZ_15040 [Actinomycetota bacterium]
MPLLVYLHADRFVARSSRLIDGTPVPCSDQAVHTQPLATLLFASAFWSLRELGLLDMEVVERRNVLGMFPHAEIKVAPRGRDERPGLEGSILDNLEGEEALRDVVCRWSGSHSTDPWHDTVHEAVSEAVAGGYLTEVKEDCGALARFLWGGSHLEPDCRRIGGLGTTVERFADSWRRFQQDTLCDRLTEQCKKSLLACTERWYA